MGIAVMSLVCAHMGVLVSTGRLAMEGRTHLERDDVPEDAEDDDGDDLHDRAQEGDKLCGEE